MASLSNTELNDEFEMRRQRSKELFNKSRMPVEHVAEISKEYLRLKDILTNRAKAIINLVEGYTPEEREAILYEKLCISFWEVYQGKLHVIIRDVYGHSDIEEELDGLPVEYLLASDEEFDEIIGKFVKEQQILETKNQIKELQDKLKKLEK